MKKLTAKEFCCWLQGHFEINGQVPITGDKLLVIRNRLNGVFGIAPMKVPEPVDVEALMRDALKANHVPTYADQAGEPEPDPEKHDEVPPINENFFYTRGL